MKNIGKLLVCVPVLLNTVVLTAQQSENLRTNTLENQNKMNTTQTEKNKEVIRKLYTECLNTGNLALLDQIISEDYVTDYKGRIVHGPEGYAVTVREVLKGFPDIRFSLEGLIAEGNMVTARWKSEGTHKNTFFGFPASGKRVVNRAAAVYELKNGKVVKNHVYPDRLGVLQQIGAIPESAAFGKSN